MARADEPAFPQHVINPTAQSYGVASNTGMSIREWFAGQALKGIMLACEVGGDPMVPTSAAAIWAFAYADAMIAESQKK